MSVSDVEFVVSMIPVLLQKGNRMEEAGLSIISTLIRKMISTLSISTPDDLTLVADLGRCLEIIQKYLNVWGKRPRGKTYRRLVELRRTFLQVSSFGL